MSKAPFYNSIEEYKHKKGRKPHYLTIELFEKFLSNDFWHLKRKVDLVFWVVLVILGAIITKWVMG